MESINASYFKARCLKILDRVRDTGERIGHSQAGPAGGGTGASQPGPNRGIRSWSSRERRPSTGDIVGPVVPEALLGQPGWTRAESGGPDHGGGDEGPPQTKRGGTGGE